MTKNKLEMDAGFAEEMFTMRLLPKEQIEIELLEDGKRILASFFEYPIELRHYELFFISDFPNNLASTLDFERCGINLRDLKASASP